MSWEIGRSSGDRVVDFFGLVAFDFFVGTFLVAFDFFAGTFLVAAAFFLAGAFLAGDDFLVAAAFLVFVEITNRPERVRIC
jgi:energy-converting hydrogenase Eha subunit B